MTQTAAALSLAMPAGEVQPAAGQSGGATDSGAASQPQTARRRTTASPQVSGEVPSRLEAPSAPDFTTARNSDPARRTRLRMALRLNAGRRLRLAAEWQDARRFGYRPKAPASVANRLDLRLAWLEMSAVEGPGWSLRAGRQTLRSGKGRLPWEPDWANTGRAFNAPRPGFASRCLRPDAFVGPVAAPRDVRSDWCDRNQLRSGPFGAATARSDFLLEPYLLAERHAGILGEPGRPGTLVVDTPGVRAAGRTGRRLDWEPEAALPRVRAAGGVVRAWGAFGQAGWPAASAADPVRWALGDTVGSGDAGPADGLKGTFDTLYRTAHVCSGATGRIGRARIQDGTLRAEWRCSRRLRLSSSRHDFRLATLRDALGSPGGDSLPRNPLDASRHAGWEQAAAPPISCPRASPPGPAASLLPGPFLRHSVRSGATQPDVFLSDRS